MALGSTQPLAKMSTRNIPGGKGGRCVRLTTSPPPRAKCHEIWEPKPSGTLWATPGLLRDCFTFYSVVPEWPATHSLPSGSKQSTDLVVVQRMSQSYVKCWYVVQVRFAVTRQVMYIQGVAGGIVNILNMKSGSLKLLEPSGPHRACYGTALVFL
jgi:hypothetical protein